MVSGRGHPIAIGDQSELYYFGPVLSWTDAPAPCCSCRGATLRLYGGSRQADLQFLLPSLGHTQFLILEEGLAGWVPLFGLGLFLCVSSAFQGC